MANKDWQLDDPVAHARTLDAMYVETDARLQLLLELNTEVVAQRYDNTMAAHGRAAIHNILILAYIQALVGLVMDTDPRTCSLSNLRRMLEYVPTYAACRERFVPDMEVPGEFLEGLEPEEERRVRAEYRANHRAEHLEVFDREYVVFRREFRDLVESPLIRKFKTARNKVTAHTEMIRPDGQKPPEPFRLKDVGLKWEDLPAVLAHVQPVLYRGVLLASNTGYDWEGAQEINERIAKDWWAFGAALPSDSAET